MTVLVTGVAGFIGYHVSEALLARGERVIGIDIVNDYYDVALKEAGIGAWARPALLALSLEPSLHIAERLSFGRSFDELVEPLFETLLHGILSRPSKGATS